MDLERHRPTRYYPPAPVPVDYPAMRPTLRDISDEGAYISDKRPLGLGRIIQFQIQLPESSIPIRAIVRRSEPDLGMAVEFIEISHAARDQLQRWLASLAQSGGVSGAG